MHPNLTSDPTRQNANGLRLNRWTVTLKTALVCNCFRLRGQPRLIRNRFASTGGDSSRTHYFLRPLFLWIRILSSPLLLLFVYKEMILKALFARESCLGNLKEYLGIQNNFHMQIASYYQSIMTSSKILFLPIGPYCIFICCILPVTCRLIE